MRPEENLPQVASQQLTDARKDSSGGTLYDGMKLKDLVPSTSFSESNPPYNRCPDLRLHDKCLNHGTHWTDGLLSPDHHLAVNYVDYPGLKLTEPSNSLASVPVIASHDSPSSPCQRPNIRT